MRIDGRHDDQMRPVRISRGYSKYAEGSALIEVGDTKLICTATVEDKVPPFLRETGQGWVTAEYGMLPRSAKVRIPRESIVGKIGGRTHEIQRLVGRSLRAVTDLQGLGERTVLLDCDVVQADGGTRTAAITGSFVALAEALSDLAAKGLVKKPILKDFVAAVSVGFVEGRLLLDLCYAEDSMAEVDMNVVMTGSGKIVEIQGTAEETPFNRTELERMLELASAGIRDIISIQREIVPAGLLATKM
ncbi:MAG: ribonuclease PH [candidate division NC10 bacterium]|nr:ribonuclease PH [candidate division NC10 bacterium]